MREGQAAKLEMTLPFENEHPYIMRYVLHTDFGYIMTMVTNSGSAADASYIERMSYESFEGLKLMAPEGGT